MSERPLATVILAAGLGTRMNSDRPKVLHPVGGRPMLAQEMATAAGLAPARQIIVVAPAMREKIAAHTPDARLEREDHPLGTSHAMQQAQSLLGGIAGDLLLRRPKQMQR